MKKPYSISVFLLLCALAIPFSAYAITVDAPHAALDTSCSTCHTNHKSLNNSAAYNNNVCQTCHRVGDSAAGAKPLPSADAANPYKSHLEHGGQKMYQTSHRWEGSLTEPLAGAQPPIQGFMSSAVRRSFGELSCTICHNQHDNSKGKFLVADNKNDAMCMDCHRSRAVTSSKLGSHPVNVAVPGTAAYKVLQNAANPTADLSLQLAKTGGKVVCSTCHGVHYTDSRSSTFDGYSSRDGRGRNFYNLSTSDGFLLRTDHRGAPVNSGIADNKNICTNCHAGKVNHNYKSQNVQCVDCHGAHVEYDPNDPANTKGTNKYLIRRNVTKFGEPSQIMFRYTGSKREYVNNTNNGVCQGCHDVPPQGGIYPPEHSSNNPATCTKCHAHDNKRGSFAGACNTCHGHPPKTASIGTNDGLATPATNAATSPGAHESHVTKLGLDCSTCHNGYSGRTMPNNTIDMGFAIDASKYPGFKAVDNRGIYGNTNVLNAPYTFTGNVDRTGATPNQNCANVYCHGATLKNSSGVNSGTHTSPNWVGGSNEAQCDSCHKTFGTGPGTAGHTRHTVMLGCDNCHGTLPLVSSSGGTWFGPNHVNGITDWDVSALGAPQAGSPQPVYKANNGVYATLGATASLAPSAVYGSCSAIYCHSNVQGSTGTGSPTVFTEVSWSGSQLTCGSCHVNMLTSTAATGSHITHAQKMNISCATCHVGYTSTSTDPNLHAKNFAIDVKFPGTGIAAGSLYKGVNTGNKAPGSGYASCTTSYCHSNSGPNASTRIYGAPLWGGAKLTCAGCHLDMSTNATGTGNHKAHSSSANVSGPQYGCDTCHAGYTSTTVNVATHVNQSVNLSFASSAATTYTKTNTFAAGSTFGSCSSKNCHGSSATIPWGTTALWSTTDQCAKCHAGPSTGGTFYSTAFPVKQTSNTDVKVGAHTAHLAGTIGRTLVCSDCHGTVTLKSANHMNGTTNFVWSSVATNGGLLTPTYSAGKCDNVYCHGAGLTGGTTAGKTPSWNVPFLPATLTPEACGSCHGFPPATPRHQGLTTPTGFPTTSCGCHPTINSLGTTYADIFKVGPNGEKHIDGKLDGAGSCNACHGYPPANKRFKGTHNNWSSARMESYSGSGGAHTVAGHVSPTASPLGQWTNCSKCHNPADHAMAPLEFKPSKNIKVTIDSRVRFANVPAMGKYSSNKLDGAAHVPGRCSNVACHFQKSPKW